VISSGTVTPPTPSWGSAMLDALLGSLGRPAGWAIALAGFLARGGLVVLVAPIVVIPSTIGLANAVAPTVTPLLFGEASPELLSLIGGVILALTAWVILGGLIGVWADLMLVRAAAADDDVDIAVSLPVGRGAVWRGLAVRLMSLLPLVAALGWGSTRIIDAMYRQVILPDELSTPIVLRVLRDVPDAIGVIVLAWLVGEAVGGIAQRRLWSSEVSIPGALLWAVGRIVRRPFTSAATLAVTTVAVAAAVLPPALVAGIAWERLRIGLASQASAPEIAVALVVFVCLWFAALLLAGAATSLRSFAWTAETYRPVPVPAARPVDRTIGDAGAGRPGEWPSAGASGRL